MSVEPDGFSFDPASVQVSEIREDQDYEGQRVELTGRLGNDRIKLQIDIGFGDVVTPRAKKILYPTFLDQPAPQIRAYPPETVVAEKCQAMVVLGLANSRMKDFFDLLVLARQFEFEGSMLMRAIQATFKHRKTKAPAETPLALTEEFANDSTKVLQWKAFIKRIDQDSVELSHVISQLNLFLALPLLAVAQGVSFHRHWAGGGPWR
jgi:hypothetical protein